MRIAFLTLNAYDMLTGEGDTVGGAQLQQVLLGRELAARGHDVVFIENEGTHKDQTTVDGIRIVTQSLSSESSRLTSALFRPYRLLSLLAELSPDVCYVRMPLFELLPTAAYCMVSDTSLVYGFAHDSELQGSPAYFTSRYTDNLLYRSLVNAARARADALVVQNESQQALACEQYDSRVVQIYNGYPRPARPHDDTGTDSRPVVLWVSTLRSWKRPEVVLKLADRIQEADFVIIGPAADGQADLFKSVKAEADTRSNVRFCGFVPYNEIDEYFAAADAFCNTSTSEGFPNTFLQAWAHGTPVFSLTVDPDDILSENAVGACANGNFDVLAKSLTNYLSGLTPRTEIGGPAQIYNYFDRNHSIDAITDQYESIFESLHGQTGIGS
ncbi:glycosyltransferase family 4 protein [Natronomonas sp. EA1]|uniref:glycosyltransferase family 4 protein n=1 Tax=Natronomonas sp. EA1 TaxID=3421655 RepID=UPI003EBCE21B